MTKLLDFSKPHVLRSDEEYEAAVAEIDALLDRDIVPGSEEDERLEFLSLLVEAYDDEHFPMGGSSTPQSVVDFMLEQKGMQRSDIAEVMGGDAGSPTSSTASVSFRARRSRRCATCSGFPPTCCSSPPGRRRAHRTG